MNVNQNSLASFIRPPKTAGLIMLLTVSMLLGGCTQSPLTDLPHGVQVSVQQNRPDVADHRLQVQLNNSSDTTIIVRSLRFSSPAFAVASEYPKVPSTIRAGSTINLPVILSAPVCEAKDFTPLVFIDFTIGDREGHAKVTPSDPMNQLSGISSLQCFTASIDEIATITMPEKLRIEEHSGKLVALIDLGIRPTGAAGSFTLTAIEDTVLFAPIVGDEPYPVQSLIQNVVVRGTDAPSTLTIPVVPSRCDAHAAVEDKRGTLFPLRVTVGATEGLSYLATTQELTGKLLLFLGDACSSR